MYGFDSFALCGGFAFGGLAEVCFGENVSMFVDASIIEVESFEAADVITNVVEEVGLEVA